MSKGSVGLHKIQTVVKTVGKLAISDTMGADTGSHRGIIRA